MNIESEVRGAQLSNRRKAGAASRKAKLGQPPNELREDFVQASNCPTQAESELEWATRLSDYGGHNLPHVMFFQTDKDGIAWGANLTNSTVMAVNYWYLSAEAYPELKTFPPLSVFLVGVTKWSDGTPAPSM